MQASFCALPLGVVEHVFAFLVEETRDLCAAACVCTAWRAAAQQPLLWRTLRFGSPHTRAAITDARLAQLLARAGGQLERLDLSEAWRVTDGGLEALALQPRLARLSLSGCHGLTGDGITQALARCDAQGDALVAALLSEDTAVVARACLTLAALLEWGDEDGDTVFRLLDAGAVATLLATLLLHEAEGRSPAALRLLENGWGALAALLCSPDDELPDDLEADALAAAICGALHAHPHNAFLQLTCLNMMRWLADEDQAVAGADEAGAALVEAGAIRAVVCALRTHAGNADLVTAACRALCSCVLDTPEHWAIAGAEAARAVVAVVVLHAQHRELQYAAMKLLAQLVQDDDCSAAAGDAGGVPALITTLRAFSWDEGVLTSACGALASLTLHEPNCEAAGAAGTAQVVAVLQWHPASRTLQVNGCYTLANLCHCSVACQSAAGVAAIGAAAAAIRAWPAGKLIQKSALMLVDTLAVAGQDGVCDAAREAGIIELAAAAMMRFPASNSVVGRCCSVLAVLCEDDAAAALRASAAGAVELILAALHAQTLDDSVRDSAAWALGAICKHVRATKALDAVLANMALHVGNSAAQACGCLALHHLKSETQQAALSVLPAILGAMRVHPADAHVQQQAARALFGLLGQGAVPLARNARCARTAASSARCRCW
jgi:hypothetical protein